VSPIDDGFVPELKPDLLLRTLGHEAVVWSPARPEPTALDPIAAIVLQLIDGIASVDEMVTDIHEVVGVDVDVARGQVHRTLAQLDAAGAFLTSEPAPVPERQRELFVNPPST
jgi:hypothetical protein